MIDEHKAPQESKVTYFLRFKKDNLFEITYSAHSNSTTTQDVRNKNEKKVPLDTLFFLFIFFLFYFYT